MRRVLLLPLFVFLVAARCEPKLHYAQERPAKQGHTRRHRTSRRSATLVKKERSIYRDVQERLASLKQRVKADIDIHERSLATGDPLNRREEVIAHQQILDSANELVQTCDAALQDKTMLKTVSGSKRNIQTYRTFATGVIAKYTDDHLGDISGN